MKFKEFMKFFNSNKNYNYSTIDKKEPLSATGAGRFGRNIFDTADRTPHWEMKEILNIIETRPQVFAGLKQVVRFIMGKGLVVDSKDENSIKLVEAWLDNVPQLRQKLYNLIFLAISLGNAYLEPLYRSNGTRTTFIDFDIFPDSTRIYRYLYTEDPAKHWIMELPTTVRNAGGQQPSYERITYIKGDSLLKQNIFGLPFRKSRFDHLKLGWSRDGIYGRSFLASTIDDNNILKEILKNIAIIARFRALNTKLITPASDDMELMEDDIEYIEYQLLNKRDEDHLVLNKALKVDSLSNTNEYDTMHNELDYLRKDISSGLVPNYITPWNADVNRATADEAKIPFQLELESMTEEIIEFMNTSILEKLRKEGMKIADDTTFKFDNVTMDGKDVRVNNALNQYAQGLISFNEARELCDLETVKGGDKFSWEMQDAEGGTLFAPKKKPQSFNIKSGIQELKESVKKNKKLRAELDLEEDSKLIGELQSVGSRVKKFMKKWGVGTKIKSFKDEKGATSKTRGILQRWLLSDKPHGVAKLQRQIKDDVVKYKDGQPNIKDWEIKRVARTELRNMQALDKLLKWKSEGFTEVKHKTHFTKGTGEKDKRFNNKIFKIDYLLKHTDDRVPLHPNCRCDYILHK